MKNYKLYYLVNPDTEEIFYVGITSQLLKKRLTGHMDISYRAYKANPLKTKLLSKMKKENKRPIIKSIFECGDIEEIKNKEIRHIKRLRDEGANLLNISPGGDMPSEERMRMMTGENSPFFGKKRPEHALKMGKPVLQFDLQGNFIKKFPSAIEAARVIGSDCSGLSKCCNKKRTTLGGFKWAYEDDPDDRQFKVDKRKTKEWARLQSAKTSKAVLQLDDNKNVLNEYSSAREAAKAMGQAEGSAIGHAIERQRKSAGFYWAFKMSFEK